LILFLDLDLR